MTHSASDKQVQVSEPCVDYRCSPWTTSSQRAADLYESGVKLWRKEDLVDIEQQLMRSFTMERFTVRRIDGTVIHIKNPMFGVPKPIWYNLFTSTSLKEYNLTLVISRKPNIKFQEYWHLVDTTPKGLPETYHCTYLIDWVNRLAEEYNGLIENAWLLFETKQRQWDASLTCEAFTSQFRQTLNGDANSKRITKIVCFGLGDLHFKPSDTWRIHNNNLPEDQQELETCEVEGALVHYAIALTVAKIVRSYAKPGDREVKLVTQDPAYCDESKVMAEELGFEVVGRYGAGGFAEVDNESVVFSAFTKAPMNQIIADLARPLAVITAKKTTGGVWNSRQ
jgi:hypothetical protein